ncbi:MAG: NADH:flavin oxidoreductase/NADH oxidase family protein [bacterium]|nr:NADH:flavin oxidoreductase/NADH oxidase family protein [bacterium]
MNNASAEHSSTNQTIGIASPLTLPSGLVLNNRLIKAAMNENMAPGQAPNERLTTLYERWGKGGAGMLITGNVMVDYRHLGSPGQLVIEDERDLAALTEMAQRTQANGVKLCMQLNHPGRQSPESINAEPVAPSAVSVEIGGRKAGYATPRALTPDEIKDIIQRFATAAAVAKKAGFSGVEIHGAHGYLVSQFLSPISNQRTDEWGGELENRMRFCLEVYRAIRAAVGTDFTVGIKLNSADFQRGGFTEEESMQVVKTLEEIGMDFIEISGGTYEATAMMGSETEGEAKSEPKVKDSTRAREGYFLDYARKVRDLVKLPLMLTGGFRSKAAIQDAIAEGHIGLAGMGRPYAEDPDIARKFLNSETERSTVVPIDAGKMSGLMELGWYELQMNRLGDGEDTSSAFDARKAMVQLGKKDRELKAALRVPKGEAAS